MNLKKTTGLCPSRSYYSLHVEEQRLIPSEELPTEHDEHGEEDDGPELGQRHLRQRVREGDEHQPGAVRHHCLYAHKHARSTEDTRV